jgi:hypothetical protein
MMKGKKRISWQTIFTHSAATTTPIVDALGRMDATKDASAGAFDGARRASTSISVARQSIDISLSTSTTMTTTASTALTKSPPSRHSPPPSYLLDDDPFANLTPLTMGTRPRADSFFASTSRCIPRSQRPPPIHPELMPALSLPAVPVWLQAPKSRLQENLDEGAPESDKVTSSRQAQTKEESKGKRAKTFFVTMSTPVSPSIASDFKAPILSSMHSVFLSIYKC